MRRKRKQVAPPLPKPAQFNAYWETIGRQLLDSSRLLSSLVSHRGSIGSSRELLLREFLKKYIPRQYRVGTGFIVSPDGGVSTQQDIIIYDGHRFSPLFEEGDLVVVPGDAAVCCIEVKSTLTVAELNKSLTKSLTIRRVAPRCFIEIFAYDSPLSLRKIAEGCANHLVNLLVGNKPDMHKPSSFPAIGTVTVLTKGSIAWPSQVAQDRRSFCENLITILVPSTEREEKFVLGAYLAILMGMISAHQTSPESPHLGLEKSKPGEQRITFKDVGYYCPRWNLKEMDGLTISVADVGWGWDIKYFEGEEMIFHSPFDRSLLNRGLPNKMTKEDFFKLFDASTQRKLRDAHERSKGKGSKKTRRT